MNNLKRVLSLALSGIMLVGMMAMGASAAEFSDADKIEHTDAVNVLVALKVVNGQDDGSFNPAGDVTRAQMAKMIAVAMNGGKDTNTGVKGTATFTDIKGHWAESYIEYCSDMGIISGRGDGTFDPDGQVTGLEATKMVLTALGYDATAYRLTGAAWAVQTDELAKKADPALYEDLDDVVMANKASRDTAAQLIWNGLQNVTRRVTPQTNTSTGETTWQYGTSGKTMLEERYSANIAIGSFDGTHEVTNKGDKGEITVTLTQAMKNDKSEALAGAAAGTSFYFPSDFDLSYIGEEVKVIYKNGKDSKNVGPDKNDTIYGVFLTGKTQVLNTTKADIKNTEDFNKAGKIKVADSEYDVLAATDTSVEAVVVDFGVSFVNVKDGVKTREAAFQALAASQSPDTVKFIFNEDNKITKAYVTTYKLARVTGVTSSKITLSTDGAVDIKDNDIYDGIAKDDVVVVNRFYDGSDKDKALFVVKKAETVEGKVDGFKTTENVVVDGKTYKVADKALVNVSSDAITTLDSKNIGDSVRLYTLSGMVKAIQSLETADTNWGIVTDVDWASGTASSISPARATILFADGTEETLALHKDSKGGTGADGALVEADLKEGTLVEYSLSGGKLKTTKLIKNTVASGDTSTGTTKVYDKDTKKFNGIVAAADAKVFVVVDKDTKKTIDAKDEYKVYDLRELGNIFAADTTGTGVATKFAYNTNKNNQVDVAVIVLAEKPVGNTTNTVYGIVKSDIGTRKVNDETYKAYVVSSNGEEIEIYIPTSESLSTGAIVKFDQTANNCYDTGKVQPVTGTYVAVNEYNEDKKILSYFTSTKDNGKGEFIGVSAKGEGEPENITVDKDAKIIFVDTDNKTSSDGGSITKFDITTGKANAMFTVKDGNANLIVVETSGEGFKTTPGFVPSKQLAKPEGNSAENPAGWTFINDQADGVYTLPAGTEIDKTNVSNQPVENLVFFKYTATTAGQYTLTLTKGEKTYSEEGPEKAAKAAGSFVIDVVGGTSTGTGSAKGGDGKLESGVYAVEIATGTGDSKVVVLTTNVVVPER